jgi:hypothetical protein
VALIDTLLGPIDESQLLKREECIDNDNERTVTVEYCAIDCDGEAHRTGVAQGVGCFCPKNIRRDVGMELKRGVFAEAIAAFLG